MENLMPMNLNKLSLLASKIRTDKLNICRLFPKKVDIQALMKFYDVDGDGSITYDEFLNGLRD